ncbi:MAG: glycosyltransferase family 4 protein [Cyanobacteria bacterium P01_D01_bin.156]
MRILHINQSDIVGGAAISAYRLHKSLLTKNFNSFILADITKLSSNRIYSIKRKRLWEGLSSRLFSKLGLNYLDIKNTFSLPKDRCFQDANIINLHNLHGGYFNYLGIANLSHKKPTVLTLHDMWSFTGHCAYSFNCDRWQTGCGKCPYPDTYPSISRDSTSLEWKLKRWVYNHSNLNIVTPSKWLTGLVGQSILNHFPIHHIPNGLDITIYRPLSQEMCRSALGLPNNKKVIFFTAQSLKDLRKGGDLLLKALQKLPEPLKKDSILMTMGTDSEALTESIDIPIMALGYVGSDRLKALAYSAANLFVAPTRADNLPIVLQESMACGTPMVSFAVGGVPELVRHGITGLLAKPENPVDLSVKLTELLEDSTLRDQLSQNCRRIAIEEYSIELQAQRYISLYEKVLENFKS